MKDEALLLGFDAALTEEWKVNGKNNLQTFCWILCGFLKEAYGFLDLLEVALLYLVATSLLPLPVRLRIASRAVHFTGFPSLLGKPKSVGSISNVQSLLSPRSSSLDCIFLKSNVNDCAALAPSA